MRKLAILMFLVAAASARPSLAAQSATPVSDAMTNEDVVKMVAAGLSEQVVVGAIRQAKAHRFDLSPAALIDLKAKNVPEAVIVVMLNSPSAPTAPPSAFTTPSAFAPPLPTTAPPTNSNDPLESTDQGVEISAIYGANRAFPFSFTEAFAQGLALGGFRAVRIDAEPNDQRVIAVNVAGHLSRFVLVFTEVLYNDFGESRVSGARLLGFSRTGSLILSPRVTTAYRPTLLDWTSGVRVQFPTGTWRVRPYAAGGGGLLSLKQEATSSAGASFTERTNDFTYHVDAGTRVFVTRWFGVAPEFRVVHIPDDTFYRVLISAVFRVG